MPHLPYTKFFHGDWLADQGLILASSNTRGVWIQMLARMWQAQVAELSGDLDHLSRILLAPKDEIKRALDEMKRLNIATIFRYKNGTVRIVSRRNKRNGKRREEDKLRKRAARASAKCPQSVPGTHGTSSIFHSPESIVQSTPLPPVGDGLTIPLEYPHGQEFAKAFNAQFPIRYDWHRADGNALNKWRASYPDVTPEDFVETAQALWAKGRYGPTYALRVSGLCDNWSIAQARLKADATEPKAVDASAEFKAKERAEAQLDLDAWRADESKHVQQIGEVLDQSAEDNPDGIVGRTRRAKEGED